MTKLAGLLSVFLAVPAFAQTPPAAAPPAPPAGPPQPAPENEALKGFFGKWSCDDMTSIMRPGQPPVKVKTEYDLKPAVNKFWGTGSFTQKKQKDYPGFRGEAYFGWVASQKKYVFAGFDDAGGHVYLWAPAGGDRLAFAGDAQVMGGTAPLKYTWTKKGDKEATFVIELSQGGNWVKSSEATCKKK
jgi:hypothetical protein